MKRFLLILLLTSQAYVGSSQITDTICLPMAQARAVLIAAKQKKAQDTIINVLRSDISILEQMRSTLMQKDTTNQQIILSYRGQVGNLEQQKIVLQKEVKKWKRKTTWAAISGLVLSGLTAFLILSR